MILLILKNKNGNYDLIRATFDERDIKCIMAISLSIRRPNDRLIWAYTKDGMYSVQTAYMLGKSCNCTNFHQAWADIWKLRSTPKVRHFCGELAQNHYMYGVYLRIVTC